MAELRAWVLARLLWRPDLKGSDVIREFLTLYYGPAAGLIRRYLDLLHAPCRKGFHITPYMMPDAKVPFLTPAVMRKARALFADAIRKAGRDEALRTRVETARLPVDFIDWRLTLDFKLGRRRYEAASPAMLKKAERFFANAMQSGCEGLSESERWPIRDNIAALQGADTVELKQHGLRAVMCPRFGGRVLVLQDPRKGFNWLHVARAAEAGFPVAGGYEEYIQRQWRSPGWQIPFVASRQKQSLFLSGLVTPEHGGGVVITRALSIDGGRSGPYVRLETCVKNLAYEPASISLRLHLEIDAGNWRDTHLQCLRPGGGWMDWRGWDGKTDPVGSREFTGGDLPAGQWAVVRGDRCLLMEFPVDLTEQALVTYNLGLRALFLDLYGPTRKLLPGESIRYVQVWRPGPA